MTRREKILERLLRETWDALPAFLQEDCADEIDWTALGALADTVRAVLGEPPVEWEVFELEVPK